MFTLDLVTFALLSGVSFLGASLAPVFRLLQITRSRQLRRAWLWLAVLIIGFIIGYLILIGLLPRDTDRVLTSVICAVLVLGSIFVMSVAMLALRTASDIARLVHLEQEVVIDPLTGVYNRRYFDERFDREVALAQRMRTDISLLVVDLDHFKTVNDTYGHAAGDRVLAIVATVLSDGVRNSDIVLRYGGEEFVVIAPNTDGLAAERLADRLCWKIRTAHIKCPSETRISVTASIGFATLCDDDTTETLFARADDALYEAKRAGRDCALSVAEVADPSPPEVRTG